MKRAFIAATLVALGAALWLAATAGAAGPMPSNPQFGSGDNGYGPPSSGSAGLVTVGSAKVAQLTSHHYGDGLVSVGFPNGSTFGQLTNLSTDYNMTVGACGGGAPRYQIDLQPPGDSNPADGVSLYVYFGTAPYGGCPSGGPQTEANIIGGTAPQWFIFGGGFNSNLIYTYSQIDAMVGSYSLLDAQIADDGGWSQTGDTQTVQVMNWNVDGTVFFGFPGGNLNCTGLVNGGTYTNITVSNGATCTLANGVTVTQDVKVQSGGNLNVLSSSIGHDLSDNGGGLLFVCNSAISHDLSVQNSTGPITVGGGDGCGNTIGHDLTVQNNSGGVTVDNNAVGHDLTVKNNKGGTDVSGNSVGHDASCGNTPQTGGGNTAGHNNSCPAGGGGGGGGS